jgi:hypothetical protein
VIPQKSEVMSRKINYVSKHIFSESVFLKSSPDMMCGKETEIPNLLHASNPADDCFVATPRLATVSSP